MNGIQFREVMYDPTKILASIPFDSCNAVYGLHNQISLRHKFAKDPSDPTLWGQGVGSLYDYNARTFIDSTSSYQELNQALVGTYLEFVINDVIGRMEAWASPNIGVGRIRILRLRPTTCYTLHTDPEEFRMHIPLITNEKCFFVCGDSIERMPIVGGLYEFKTKKMHTAVNASKEERVHLVFDTYRKTYFA